MRRWGFLLAALLLAGCGRAAAPAGAVRFDLAADPATLNPLFLHQDAASVEQQIDRLSFEPLIGIDAAGREFPELLDRIPTRENGGVSADGRTLVFHLRRGVRWSDGVPVTAADVLWTLHALLDPRNPVPSREGYDLIDRASAPDPHTVVIHLRRAWAPMVGTFFSYGFRPQFVLPAHVLRHETPLARAAFNAAPSVGDGPYRFVSWQRGDSLVYDANPRYWRGKPAVAQLDIRIAPNPQTNLVLLQSGAIDWNLIAPVQMRALRGRKGLAFRFEPTSVVAGIVFNLRHSVLRDPRVRRAIAYAIDRAAISRKITLGAYPVTNALQPQFSWAFDPRVREPAYDPAKADALLDAAGWHRGPDGTRERDGKPLALVYVQFPESTTGTLVAQFVQAALRARGIAVEIKSVSNAQLFMPITGTLAKGEFDLAYVPFTMGSDPDDSSILTCGAPSNFMGYCNPQLDRLEQGALAATSQAERRRFYARIEHIAASDLPILELFDARYVYAYRTRLRNFAPNPFLPTWNAAAWRLSDHR